MKRLPDAEFEVMEAVWALELPLTAGKIMQQLENERKWVVQSVITLLMRLVERGFLQTEKNKNERTYIPLVTREQYLKFETGNFIRQYHKNSITNLINTLNDDKKLSAEDIEELSEWFKERKE
jgi:predicted transcriptional regulator